MTPPSGVPWPGRRAEDVPPSSVSTTGARSHRRSTKRSAVRIRRGAHPDLIVRLPDGTHIAIATGSTDYAGAPAVAPAGPPRLLALTGLRQAAQFLERLRREGRWPTRPS